MRTESSIRAAALLGKRDLLAESIASARQVGLRYVSDAKPGIRRLRAGRGFRYVDAQGKQLREAAELERIKKLAVPPAWTNVWICSDANGHIQATGRDARGRKQYRYHTRFRQARDETKYEHVLDFGRALPLIRAQTDKHMSLPGLPREKVLATVVRLLEAGLLRVGNKEYTRDNNTFGVTTLRNRHVSISGSTLHFEYRGKHGIARVVHLTDKRLARIVKSCRDLPGQDLFQYVDADGTRHSIGSSDVNDYLRDITQRDFTAKDFRTWGGTVLAANALHALPPFRNATQAKRNLLAAITGVSKKLGNTLAVCRKCYVHPVVMSSYLEGKLLLSAAAHGAGMRGLRADERVVLAFLQRALRAGAARVRHTARAA